MQKSWWMAPAAVLLVLGGLIAGLLLSRRQPAAAAGGLKQVHVPTVPGKRTTDKPAPADKPAGSEKPPAPEEKRPADAEALAYMTAFMHARMAGDGPRVSAMLAPAVAPGALRMSGPDLRMTAYTYELLGSGDPDTFVFRARVAFTGAQPGSEVAAEEIRLTWKGGLKVSAFGEAARESLALGVGADGLLYLHRGQDTAAAADLAALPEKFRPFGADPAVEFGTGRDGWSVAATSLTGSHVLWVTRGLHPLLGISQIKWGEAPAVTPLDLLFEAGVVDAAWAPGPARYVAVAVAEASGNTGLSIWDVIAGARFGPELAGAPGGGEYQVQHLRWLGPSVVAFDLRKGGTVTGPWTYNVSNRTLAGP